MHFWKIDSQEVLKKNLTVQHRNQVELIWSSLSEKMEMFPVHPLANIHLFKNAYHTLTFNEMRRKEGVQAGSLRARYVCFRFFIQFLRKNQVFACMNTLQLHLLEESVTDYNKNLNPFIKQRKVEIRKENLKHLLTPLHFIKFGRSDYTQKMIKKCNEYQKAKQKMSPTKAFCMQFRNYLITSLTIDNGLRSPNVTELKVRDVLSASVLEGYPGHKIVSNLNYKTSTVYGEKFLAIPVALYQQCLFYIEILRSKINVTKSSTMFVSNSKSPKMTQTAVASGLTVAFKEAQVFMKSEKTRTKNE